MSKPSEAICENIGVLKLEAKRAQLFFTLWTQLDIEEGKMNQTKKLMDHPLAYSQAKPWARAYAI